MFTWDEPRSRWWSREIDEILQSICEEKSQFFFVINQLCQCDVFRRSFVLCVSSEKFLNNSMCSKTQCVVYWAKRITVSTTSLRLIENFSSSLGVLLTATALVTEMCQQNSQALHIFRKVRSFFIRKISFQHRFFAYLVSSKSCSYPQKSHHVWLQSWTRCLRH